MANDIKLARRETAENAACDKAVTGVVDTVAAIVAKQNDLTEILTEMVNNTNVQAAKQNNLTEMLAQMVKAASDSTTAVDTKPAQAAQVGSTLYPSCMAYKQANPELKSGTYVLSGQKATSGDNCKSTHFHQDGGTGTCYSMKVYCDMENDGGGYVLTQEQ